MEAPQFVAAIEGRSPGGCVLPIRFPGTSNHTRETRCQGVTATPERKTMDGSHSGQPATTREEVTVNRNSNRNPRVANGHRRRQLRAQVLAEEDHCWLCGKFVNKDLPHGLPDSPELDEVIPVSRGGSPYDRANIRLACRLCNQRRGNGMRGQRRPVQPFTTTRQWDTE